MNRTDSSWEKLEFVNKIPQSGDIGLGTDDFGAGDSLYVWIC